MSRVLRSVRKRKKGCTLGAVDVIDREGYAELEVDAKVELIRSLVPLGLLHIEVWVANYYSARNPLRLSSLVILGVVARMFRYATRSSCWCT